MKQKVFILILIILLSVQVQAQDTVQPEKLNAYYSVALQRSAQKEHRQALAYLDSALLITPQYAPVRYAKAKLGLLAGNRQEAFAELQLLLSRKQQFVLNAQKDSVFNSQPEFIALNPLFQEMEKSVTTATDYIKLKELDLVPEGVAYDPVEKALYISSIYKRKIVKIDAANNVTDFTASGQDGLMSVLGMEVDAKRRHLWVCSSYDPANEIVQGEGLKPQAAIHKLDLKTGKLLKKYTLSDTLTHFFNDLTVLPNGDVYFTDSNLGTAYRITTKEDQIQPLFSKPFLIGANGITKDSKGENLFIASWLRGIIRYNTKTGNWKWLETDDPLAITCGVDGLAYYKGSLIVNSPMEIGGIIKLRLNASEDRVQNSELLEYRNPLFGEPTTGEIGDDTFYFIANAGLSAYDRSTGKLDKAKLTAPTILQIKL
jgi:tetratricopeptide (TPR) repeat protein